MGKYLLFFVIKPKTTLNQLLEKPISPKTLQIKIKKKQLKVDISKKPLNI